MKIDEIAKKLNNCANGLCTNCEYDSERIVRGVSLCQQHLIQVMAEECKKIGDELNDELREDNE